MYTGVIYIITVQVGTLHREVFFNLLLVLNVSCFLIQELRETAVGL